MLSVHVVPHTHWDREWYHPAGRFRQRLVALINELLDDPPPPGESFLLDGQAIVLEDYLSVCADRREELSALLRQGRLEAGPWYVLADELIPGAEALVRNLLVGRSVVQGLGEGAQPLPILYCPDSFGHPAILPELARGFGMDLIILWRGFGGQRWPPGDTFTWAAPSGASVVMFHLPRSGYEYGANLPTADAAARTRWVKIRSELGARSVTGVLLVQNGADHHARQRGFRGAVATLAAAAEEGRSNAAPADTVRASSMRGFAADLMTRARERALPEVRGELRDSYGYTWTIQGTFGTRAYQKRNNALAERLLVRDTEPWAALARRPARSTGRRAHSRVPLVVSAWKALLKTHPHDTLCGCSIDMVAREMDARLADVVAQAEGIRADALSDLLGHDAERARLEPNAWQPQVVIRNRAARARSGVATLAMHQVIAREPVGPGSGRQSPTGHVAPQAQSDDAVGQTAGIQILRRDTAHALVESPRDYPDNVLVAVSHAVAWVHGVPGYGCVAWPLGESPMAGAPPAAVRGADLALENGLVRVAIGGDGAVSIGTKGDRPHIASLLGLEDLSDCGDLYTPSLRGRAAEAEFEGANRIHSGPVRGEIVSRWRLRQARQDGTRGVTGRLDMHLILDAGAPFLRVRIAGRNLASDHRLRLVVRTGVAAPRVVADAAFGPVERVRIAVPAEDRAMETPPDTAPLHRYVSLYGATNGATVFSDGLAAYGATDDGEVAVTLVRSVGQLSRNDVPERPGHAGWPAPTPEAQCHGAFDAELAIQLHGPWSAEQLHVVEQTADDVLLPLDGTTLISATEPLPTLLGAELDGHGLVCSAIKETEDGRGMVLRCYNILDEPRDGAWRLGSPVTEAYLARLDETLLEPIRALGDTVAFRAGPRAVVTIVVR